ncbi:MAG: sporulation protein [Chloroflexota bacterium]|nr:sporulation protein [Chloroflexota bacterium]
MNVDEMVHGTQDAINVRRVFGDPIEKDGITIIPAAKVMGGGGGGADAEQNGGGGFGIRARPAGVYVIREGNVTWQPAIDVNRIVLGAQVVAIVFFLFLRAIFKRRK